MTLLAAASAVRFRFGGIAGAIACLEILRRTIGRWN